MKEILLGGRQNGKGVRKWQATIKINGQCRYFRCFESEEEAALAYNAAALEAYGSYAYVNDVSGEAVA